MKRPSIGDQVYIREDGDEIGAVRAVHDQELVIYVENAGDLVVTADQVKTVHSGKVVLDENRLDSRQRHAIAHAHDREEPGV